MRENYCNLNEILVIWSFECTASVYGLKKEKKMAVSVFDDKAKKPTEQKLTKALGKSNRLWKEIKKNLKAEYGELIEEWRFYGQKSGWILKTLRKKRNLFLAKRHLIDYLHGGASYLFRTKVRWGFGVYRGMWVKLINRDSIWCVGQYFNKKRLINSKLTNIGWR